MNGNTPHSIGRKRNNLYTRYVLTIILSDCRLTCLLITDCEKKFLNPSNDDMWTHFIHLEGRVRKIIIIYPY